MDLFEVLLAEDRQLQRLALRLEDATQAEANERRQLAAKLLRRLAWRERAEDERLAPLVEAEPKGREVLAVVRDERRALEEQVSALIHTEPHDPGFQRRSEAMSGALSRYLKREEQDLIPMARKMVSTDQARALGEALENERRSLEP